MDRQARLARVEEMKQELVEKERILTFFENKDKIELQIEQKLEKEERIYGKVSEVAQDLEENYVPPEIVKKRRNV